MKFLRGIVIALLLIAAVFAEAGAQSRIREIRIRPDVFDMTASTNMRRDNNGNPCGLLKVSVLADNVEFQGNVIGDVVRHGGAYWVYVTNGSKKIRMTSAAFGDVDLLFADWDIPHIQSRTTYIVTVEMAETGGNAAPAKRGYVQFTLTPANASIVFNGQQLDVTDGTAYKLVQYGNYNYTAQAAGYEPYRGTVSVNSGQVQIPVKLRSNKARINVTAATPGSTIYVDGALKGNAPWHGELMPGNYIVEARCEGYRPREVTVTLTAASERDIAIPALEMITGELSIEYQPFGAQIALDGKAMGTTPTLLADIPAGSHNLTISHSGYDTATLSVTVSENGTTPVTGTLIKAAAGSAAHKDLTNSSHSQNPSSKKNSLPDKNIVNTRKKIEKAYFDKKNYQKARELALTIPDDAIAQLFLGFMYEGGYGVEQDYAQAVEWFRKSAEQGDVSAQVSLGSIYKYGIGGKEGVPQNLVQSFNWYSKAAEQGNVRAQYNLGWLYEKGWGVAKDYSSAMKWYRKAAEQGYAPAQYNIGIMYKNGLGVEQDYMQAMNWYRKAAEQGYDAAQYNLGWLYENGDGVAPNINEARKWYEKAAAQGHSAAKAALKRMGQ